MKYLGQRSSAVLAENQSSSSSCLSKQRWHVPRRPVWWWCRVLTGRNWCGGCPRVEGCISLPSNPTSLHQANPQRAGLRVFPFHFPPQLKALWVQGTLFQPHRNLQRGVFHSNKGTENDVCCRIPGLPPIGTMGWNYKKSQFIQSYNHP